MEESPGSKLFRQSTGTEEGFFRSEDTGAVDHWSVSR